MNWLRSPLARQPRLLGRKIAFRLGFCRGDGRVPVPAVATVAYPAHWAGALRAWIQTVPLASAPHPFHHVFRQEFDEALLLKLCREGPRHGEAGLTGDIKLVWDYSRGQPLFTNAAAGPEHLEFCMAFLRRWTQANADTNGPAWSCAMDIAIRTANWIFADVLFGGELGRQLGSSNWAGWLWRDGWLIWRRLEARLVSSNHYLANLLGLFLVGTIFPQDAHARRWHRFTRSEFPRALLAQTRSDGGLGEASLRYHAYVTEMALLFRLAQGAPFPRAAEARLRNMCQIVADFQDATGDVFALGDDDSGRVLAVDFVSPAGRAKNLLTLAAAVLGENFSPSADAICPESGWWVRRAGDYTVVLDFGGVGLHGRGSHAHNDDFTFCLDWRGQAVITDPGTFLYTSDHAARNRFRSTLFHNTLVVDDREQRELSDDPFLLPGRDKAFPTAPLGGNARTFWRHVGPAIIHRREVSVRDELVSIRDIVEGSGRHRLQWRFHLHPAVQPSVTPCGFTLAVPKVGTLLLETPQTPVVLDIVESEYSPGYGRRQPALVCVASHEVTLPFSAEWGIRLLDKS